MPRHIVFVRFFLGFTETFPFNRFDDLDDDGIPDAVEALRQERLDGAGWGVPMEAQELIHGISRRYPVLAFATKADAKGAAESLQERVAELSRATWAKRRWNDEDDWLAQANPRFTVVSEKDLSPSKVTVVAEQIQRLRGPVPENPTIEEGLLRFYWKHLLPTLTLLDPTLKPATAEQEVKPPFDLLQAAAKKLRLKGNGLAIVEEICRHNGSVSVKDLALSCGWEPPYTEWNSARERLNRQLKKHDWRLETEGKVAVAKQIKSTGRK